MIRSATHDADTLRDRATMLARSLSRSVADAAKVGPRRLYRTKLLAPRCDAAQQLSRTCGCRR